MASNSKDGDNPGGNLKDDNPFENADSEEDVLKIEKTLQERNQLDNLNEIFAAIQRARIATLQLTQNENEVSENLPEESNENSLKQKVFFEGRYVKLIQLKSIVVRKFNTVGKDYRIKFLQKWFESNIELSLVNLYFAFEEILRKIFENIPAYSFGRFVIMSDYLDTPVSVRFQPIQNITAEMVFAEVSRIVFSRKHFKLNDDMRIHVMTCIPPAGSGPTDKKRKNISASESEFKKRSCHKVCENSTDFLCLSRAIIIGKALTEYAVGSNMRVYHLKDRKCAKIDEQINDLHLAAGISKDDRLYDINDVDIFQKSLQGVVRIYVFEKTNKVNLVYSGLPAPDGKNIYLYLRQKHYHLITDINKFLPHKKKFCSHCCVQYGKGSEYRHAKCTNTCEGCFHADCPSLGGEKILQQNSHKCDGCNRFWPTYTCFQNHLIVAKTRKKSACDLYKKCEICLSIVSRTILNKNRHVCFESYCNICKKKYVRSGEHECTIKTIPFDEIDYALFTNKQEYIQAKLDACKRPHYFFDIETEVINGCHEPILLIMQNEKGEEQAFYGKQCIKEFCDEVMTEKYSNTIFISHGGRNYDNFFPLRYCYINNIVPRVIFNGAQILLLEITQFNITFKDNLCFLTTALANLPRTMGLDIHIEKGFFPYKMPFPYSKNHVVDLPSKEMFCIETMKEDRRCEFETWYENRMQNDFRFDYFTELVTYCSQDVRILRLAASKFRELIIEIGNTDPYDSCLTLAHLCSVIFRKKYLEKNTMGIIPHDGLPFAKKYSAKSIKYFEYLMSQDPNLHIKHQLNGREKKILDRFYVDGFAEAKDTEEHDGTVYEFAGCFHHGHSCQFAPKNINEFHNKTFEELYAEFSERVLYIQENGFKVVVIWECEFDKKYKNDSFFKSFVENLEIVDKLRPGDALYGGRNEVFRLFKKAQGNEVIRYLDFRSLYPAVMSFEKYPKGLPDEIILHPSRDRVLTFFGLAKVKVLAPQNIPIGVLPYRHGKGEKIFYTLCRTCSQNQQNFRCTHSESEREFIGTYCSFELQLAIKHGYKICKCFELWHWNEHSQSNSLFADYILSFFRIKMQSEGFPSNCKTEDEKKQYHETINKENNLNIEFDDIVKNAGLRNTAKSLINSLWGKLSMQPGKPQTRYITDTEEYFSFLRDTSLEILDALPVSDDMVLTSFKIKNKIPSQFTNVAIASMVTSYARCWLFNKCISILKPEQVLYVDTDSIIFSTFPGYPDLISGNGLGELSDEIEATFQVKDTIETWCASGNKSYSIVLKENSQISLVKVKGFTLKLAGNTQDIDFKAMVDLVMKHPDTTIELIQPPLFVKDKTNAQIYTKPRAKLFKFNYNNKIILPSLQTKPYGFIGVFPNDTVSLNCIHDDRA